MNLNRYRERYREELFERVIPFWMRHSQDLEHGGYFTCLDRDGTVYDGRKYVWLQGRAAWTFSKLYNDVEPREEWLEFSRSCVQFLQRHVYDSRGRCYFSLTREGAPVAQQRKPYAGVFVALGLLEYAKATGEVACREEAKRLFADICRWIAQPSLLDRPAFAGAKAMRSSADWMVVALLLIEIIKVDDDPAYRELLRKSLDDVFAFYNREHRMFMEFAGDGIGALPEGRLACPGSSLEVAWFALHVMEALGDYTRRAAVLESIEGALEFGWDREYGGLYYFMDVEGRPCLQLEANMKLWWPHTEAIYALVLAATMTGEEKWARWLEIVDEYAFRHFADPKYGEWFGYCDRRGELTHTLKGNNYKGAFHVPRALLFSAQRIDGRAV